MRRTAPRRARVRAANSKATRPRGARESAPCLDRSTFGCSPSLQRRSSRPRSHAGISSTKPKSAGSSPSIAPGKPCANTATRIVSNRCARVNARRLTISARDFLKPAPLPPFALLGFAALSLLPLNAAVAVFTLLAHRGDAGGDLGARAIDEPRGRLPRIRPARQRPLPQFALRRASAAGDRTALRRGAAGGTQTVTSRRPRRGRRVDRAACRRAGAHRDVRRIPAIRVTLTAVAIALAGLSVASTGIATTSNTSPPCCPFTRYPSRRKRSIQPHLDRAPTRRGRRSRGASRDDLVPCDVYGRHLDRAPPGRPLRLTGFRRARPAGVRDDRRQFRPRSANPDRVAGRDSAAVRRRRAGPCGRSGGHRRTRGAVEHARHDRAAGRRHHGLDVDRRAAAGVSPPLETDSDDLREHAGILAALLALPDHLHGHYRPNLPLPSAGDDFASAAWGRFVRASAIWRSIDSTSLRKLPLWIALLGFAYAALRASVPFALRSAAAFSYPAKAFRRRFPNRAANSSRCRSSSTSAGESL